jgi:hypothetical protein
MFMEFSGLESIWISFGEPRLSPVERGPVAIEIGGAPDNREARNLRKSRA